MMIIAALLALLPIGPKDSDDDLRLAAALARRGWIELAEELVERVKVDPAASPKAKATLPLVVAEVAVEKARRAAGPAESVPILDAALAALRAVPKPAVDVRWTTGWVLGERARILESDRGYAELEEFHRAFIADLKKMASSREVDDAQFESRFALSQAQLSHAKVGGLSAPARKLLVQQSMDGYIELQYDLQGSAAWEAQLGEARCVLELGDLPKAEARFLALVELQKLLPRKIDPADPGLQVVHGATLGLAQAMVRRGKAKEAVALVDRFLAQNPKRNAIGLALELEKATALQPTDPPAAFALALKVRQADPTGPIGRDARARIAAWGGTGRLGPEGLLSLADTDLSQGRPKDALVALATCVESCTTALQKATIEAAAVFKQAEALRQLSREAESVTAFERVFRDWPAHELSSRAGVEAARILAGDKAQEARLEGILVELGKRGAGGDPVKLLHAEMSERKGKWREAADLYAGVGESSEYFGRAMVSAGHCYRRAAELPLAEASIRKFVSRPEAKGPVAAVAWRELATVHLAQKRTADALDCLEKAAGQEGQDADSRMRTWELQVQAQLGSGKAVEAAATLDRMLKEKPDATSTIRACRTVFKALEPAKGVDYARRWLDLVNDPPVAELMDAADVLYRGARALNGFGDKVASFVDLEDRALKDRGSWLAAAQAHRQLAEAKGLDDKDRLTARIRLARSLSFLARDEKEWAKAKDEYEGIVRWRKAVGANGLLDQAVIEADPSLFSVYIELGEAYLELAKPGTQKFQYDNAMTVFANVMRLAQAGTVTWWHAKYRIIGALYERGRETDIRDATVLIENLERNNPTFDDGKFGMKAKFEELRDKIRKVSGR